MVQEIERCSARFAFQCPKHWAELATTDREHVRYCGACSENVYLCTSEAEIAEHRDQRHCVAVEASLLDAVVRDSPSEEPKGIEPLITVGVLEPMYQQIDTERIVERIRAILDSDALPEVARVKLEELLDRMGEVGSTGDMVLEEFVLRHIESVPGSAQTVLNCPECGQPLRTALAKQCFECGADWH